jgi:S-(hydroxymethyl)glutathione dehydrogenase/alcohol dehydrogenase
VTEPVRAAVVRKAGQAPTVEEIELSPPGPAQVRVRLHAAGVCHSDLSIAQGALAHPDPVVLGHEAAGRVVEVGEAVWGLEVGDPVVLTWSAPCRDCWHCDHREPYLCQHAQRAERRAYARLADGTPVHPCLGVGGLATETVIDEAACVRLPEDVPLAQAALLGCAVLTGVGAVRNAARVRPGESVAVFGLGGVGLSAVQGARIAGAAQIIAVDPAPGKLALARRLGATDGLEPGPDVARRIRARCGDRGADVAIECVGRAETIRAAWSCTRRGGRTTVVGLGSRDDPVTFNALELTYLARSLSGCMYGSADPSAEIPLLLDHHRAGRLDLAALIAGTVDLDDIDAALDRLAAGTGARDVVLPNGAPAAVTRSR